MEQITEDNIDDFLTKVNRLEGGNIENIDINLGKDHISIKAYPEGAPIQCEMILSGIKSYKINDFTGCEFLGLSGYPNSLEIILSDEEVLVAIGCNEISQDAETLKNGNFYVVAKKLHVVTYK